MRHDRRYWKTHNMITHPEIPRFKDGIGIRLCHVCQRLVYFAGGFLELLLRRLDLQAKVKNTADMTYRAWLDRLKVGAAVTKSLRGNYFHEALRSAVEAAAHRNGWTIRYQRERDSVTITRKG